MVGEQPYKSRDMVGSDSGLGDLLIITLISALIKYKFGALDSVLRPRPKIGKLFWASIAFSYFCKIV